MLDGTYNWLDLTARGRQEDWERPPGRSDSPALGMATTPRQIRGVKARGWRPDHQEVSRLREFMPAAASFTPALAGYALIYPGTGRSVAACSAAE
jgi:hypothetical protein